MVRPGKSGGSYACEPPCCHEPASSQESEPSRFPGHPLVAYRSGQPGRAEQVLREPAAAVQLPDSSARPGSRSNPMVWS